MVQIYSFRPPLQSFAFTYEAALIAQALVRMHTIEAFPYGDYGRLFEESKKYTEIAATSAVLFLLDKPDLQFFRQNSMPLIKNKTIDTELNTQINQLLKQIDFEAKGYGARSILEGIAKFMKSQISNYANSDYPTWSTQDYYSIVDSIIEADLNPNTEQMVHLMIAAYIVSQRKLHEIHRMDEGLTRLNTDKTRNALLDELHMTQEFFYSFANLLGDMEILTDVTPSDEYTHRVLIEQ